MALLVMTSLKMWPVIYLEFNYHGVLTSVSRSIYVNMVASFLWCIVFMKIYVMSEGMMHTSEQF